MDKLQSGQTLGSYRIINEIGAGGMASVYKAYQASMDRNVAIKVLPGQLAESQEFVKRFQQESRTIAKLEHPYILPVFDYGEENGTAYFVMRYLEAGTLKDKMKTSALSLSEIDRIFTQLADALGYAHAQGVIHRDLKPANVLVDANGNLFLTDFGIAKLLESASPRLTQTDAILGTPAYISPEQAAALNVDQRSDIYSLGIILYEMVTGQVPFLADTPLAVILKHLQDPLPLPSKVKPDISPAIEQVILKALAKDPDDRFANTAEFLSAWKDALKDISLNTGKISASQSTGKIDSVPSTSSKHGRSLTGWAIGCVVLICLVITAVGGLGLATSYFNRNSQAIATEISTQESPTQISAPTENFIPNIILEDDFSSNQNWGTISDANSLVQYEDETLRAIVYRDDWLIWSTPNQTGYENVHIEVTVINNDTDPNTAFGLMCHQQAGNQSFYYLVITPAGGYIAVRVDNGQLGEILTNNGQWGYSSQISQNASSYRLGADCGDGNMNLYVDGQEIASINDDTYTNGKVGIAISSAVNASNTDISFDDFLITTLP
ncbi:MAG: serine/threonine protein kinase [Anaerolineales bacterium]|nr:serine/threonine protein kinase [Anaerolineales bacterium]